MEKEDLEELAVLAQRLVKAGTRTVTDFLDNYEEFRSALSDCVDSCDDRDTLEALNDIQEPAIEIVNKHIKPIVTGVYDEARAAIERDGDLEAKLDAIMEAKGTLERIAQYPEHRDHRLLKSALGAIEDFEMKLMRHLAKEDDAREEKAFREAVSGITYTATDKQVRYLLALGAKPEHLVNITKTEASALIDRLIREKA